MITVNSFSCFSSFLFVHTTKGPTTKLCKRLWHNTNALINSCARASFNTITKSCKSQTILDNQVKVKKIVYIL